MVNMLNVIYVYIHSLYSPWKRLAREPLALSRGVSPSLFAKETIAP